MTLRKLQIALAIYAALALATYFLVRGDIRIQAVLWVLFAGLALKSWAAYKLHQ
jgi:hypothetical protein